MKGLSRGTNVFSGELAEKKRLAIDSCISVAKERGFEELFLPCINNFDLYEEKNGGSIEGQMYLFQDKKGRDLCLKPEGTALVQQFYYTNNKPDQKYFYVTQCFRYERPQKGRYREFTQFGVEIIRPKNLPEGYKDRNDYCMDICSDMLSSFLQTKQYSYNEHVERGLQYYNGLGFEVDALGLGSQKQIAGGGSYEEGIGFAIGIDRVIHLDFNN